MPVNSDEEVMTREVLKMVRPKLSDTTLLKRWVFPRGQVTINNGRVVLRCWVISVTLKVTVELITDLVEK